MNTDQRVKPPEPAQNGPSLDELIAACPEEWETVQSQLAELFGRGRTEELAAYLQRLAAEQSVAAKRSGKTPTREAVRYRMAAIALRQHAASVASGLDSGTIRFNLLDGLIAQKLLFADALERKPVSLFWFRLIWPLVRQKRYLMPLVQPRGIYCFYSDRLIEALATIIGGRSCLEIAAGDGTLTRFLRDRGVELTATDDRSWQHSVDYPDWVVPLDAKEALDRYAPEVVLCSWPPAGNNFERRIFRTRSVRLYILITSRHRFAAGNWEAYREQQLFAMQEETGLSRLVLPPEIDAGVYLFTRLPAAVA